MIVNKMSNGGGTAGQATWRVQSDARRPETGAGIDPVPCRPYPRWAIDLSTGKSAVVTARVTHSAGPYSRAQTAMTASDGPHPALTGSAAHVVPQPGASQLRQCGGGRARRRPSPRSC